MDFDTIHFSLSEEAFLLNSLQEVTKVWARASGKANFNLSVQDGQAHLQLGFQLGLPDDYHLPPPPGAFVPKYKGSVRKERDRQRAAEHQARLRATSTLDSEIVVPASPQTHSSKSSNRAAPATSKSTTASVVPIASSTTSPTAVSASSTTDSVSTTGSRPKVPVTTTAVPAPSPTSNAAASAPTPSTTPTPIVPSRPIRPYCQPDRSDPLKELPYFLDDLRVKVYFSQNKELKVRHRSIALAFANQVKKDPDILFKSKNYEETFTNFCDENDQHLYKEMFIEYIR